MSRRSQSFAGPPSRKTICAASAARVERAAERDRDVGLLHRDRVVDAVADEADLPPFRPEPLDVIGLVGGQDPGERSVHAQGFGERPRRRLMVPGEDRDVRDPATAEALDDVEDRGPDGGAELDRPGGPVVFGHHDHRVTLAVGLLQGVPDLGRRGDPFALEEPAAADADRLPLDADGDAGSDLVLRSVRVGEAQVEPPGLLPDRHRDRVVELPLGGGGEEQDAPGVNPSEAMIRPTSGRSRVRMAALSKTTVSISFIRSSARPSLTRDPLSAQRASELSIASGAAMRMPVPRSLWSNARRRPDPWWPARRPPDPGRGARPCRPAARPSAARRAGSPPFVEDPADRGRGGLAARGLDRDVGPARDHQRRGEHAIADALLGRGRFARHRVRIDHRHALDDVPVDRYDVAGVHDDEVPLPESVEGHLDLVAIAVQPGVIAAACRRRRAAFSGSCPASARPARGRRRDTSRAPPPGRSTSSRDSRRRRPRRARARRGASP